VKQILFLILIFASAFLNAQPKDHIDKLRDYNIFFNSYSISIPKQLRIQKGKNSSCEYLITYKPRYKKGILNIWIFSGYSPVNDKTNPNYILSDSVKVEILGESITFLIFEKDNWYFIQGAKIEDPIITNMLPGHKLFPEICISSICEGKNNFDYLIKLLKSLNIKELQILSD
jgi:hypothetical protein